MTINKRQNAVRTPAAGKTHEGENRRMEPHSPAAGSVKMQRLWPLMNISQLAAAGYLEAAHSH